MAEATLSQLLSMSEDELLLSLGDTVVADMKMGTSVSDVQKRAFARKWFQAQFTRVRIAICENQLVKDLSDKGDTVPLVNAIIPLLGLPPAVASTTVVAVLLVRIGVRRMCEQQWTAVG